MGLVVKSLRHVVVVLKAPNVQRLKHINRTEPTHRCKQNKHFTLTITRSIQS